jgi:uncharacterized protein YjbI with pentapeptide repeats
MADIAREEIIRRAQRKEPIERANLAGLDLSGAALDGLVLVRCDLSGANLDKATMRGAKLSGTTLKEAFLSNADLSNSNLEGAELEGAVMRATNLRGANLTRANLEGADLEGADAMEARLVFAYLDGAKLGRAKLRGAILHNVVATEAYFGGVDASKADFTGADLTRVSFEDAVLQDAVFTHARLGGANARGADFARASFVKADLVNTVLAKANLTEVDARHADITGANLEHAVLTGARIAGITGTGTPIRDVAAVWIDTSVRGDGSKRLSNGKIPAILSGHGPAVSAGGRHIGRGDVLREAKLEFAAGAEIEIDGLLERCHIKLGDGAELIVGEHGVLADCTIEGQAKIVLHGKFFEGQSPGIVEPTELLVMSKGVLVSTVRQNPNNSLFSFEPGSRLRMKVLRPNANNARRDP